MNDIVDGIVQTSKLGLPSFSVLRDNGEMNEFSLGPTDSVAVVSPALDSLITFLDLWRPLMPVRILANVL